MNNLKNQKVIEQDITSISALIGNSSLSTVSNTLIGAINEIHDGYLPLSGGTLEGRLYVKGNIYLEGKDLMLRTRDTTTDDSGDIVWYYGNEQEKMRLWSGNNYTVATAPSFRQYTKDGTALYTGCLPLGNGTGASGTWPISITGGAQRLDSIRTIGGSTFAAALQSNFNSYKSSTARNTLLHYYSSAGGNGSAVFGYYLNGYDSNPYGGFYVCHYNSAKYVGIQNGTYTQYEITKSASSSRKVKENISLMTDEQVNNLLNLSVINFDYKPDIENGKKNQKGIIIEELIDTMPECIVNLDDYNGDNSEILQVDYTKFVPYLIKLCQKQQREIDKLKARG